MEQQRRRESDKLGESRTAVEILADDLHHWKNYIADEMRKHAGEMSTFRADLAENTSATVKCALDVDEIKKDTAATRQILQNWRAGRSILSGIGTVGFWFMSVVGTVVIIVQAIRGKLL